MWHSIWLLFTLNFIQDPAAFTEQLHDWRACESPVEYRDMPDHVYLFQVRCVLLCTDHRVFVPGEMCTAMH